ncbi:MAG: response regulator [Thermodesulfobacteriota bacterium]
MDQATATKRILIVDDTPVMAQLLARTLSPDYDILVAENGRDGIAAAAAQPMPDLILLDIAMPEMDGYEVCRRLKNSPSTADIPVIFLTAMDSNDDQNRGFAAGAVDYITKPFNPILIKARVNAHLQTKRNQEELEFLVQERTRELLEINRRLQQEIQDRSRSDEINQALYSISNAVNTSSDLDALYRSIHRIMSRVIDAADFLIATYEPGTETIRYPYWVNESRHRLETEESIRVSNILLMEVIKTGRSMVFRRQDILALVQAAVYEYQGLLPEVWLGVPLKSRDTIIGAVAVQHDSDPDHFDVPDVNVLHTVSGQIAMAIEQKRAQEALRKSEERHSKVLEATSDGIWDWDIRTNGLYVDPSYYRLLDYEPYEFPNRIEEWWKVVHPDDVKPLRRALIAHLKAGTEKFNAEFRARKKNGDFVWISGRGKVVEIDAEGRPTRMAGTHTEITHRKLAEQALSESQERYKRLSEVTIEGVLFHDKGVVIDCNDSFAAMFGYQRDELLGKNVIEVCACPEYHEMIYQNVRDSYNEPYEIKGLKKDGTVFPVELEGKESHYFGKILRVTAVRDLSERKRTEEKMIRMQKMEAIGTLAGGIAHDFNNLLGGILGNIGLLQMYLPEGGPAWTRLKTIEKIVHRGANLAKQLLGYAREGKYQISPININLLIRETLEMFGRTRRQVIIHSHLQNDPWTVEGDPTQIEQVLLNLYINAADAMPNGGELFVETENMVISKIHAKQHLGEPGQYVMISVRDTGHGMDKEIKKRIFDPFFTTKDVGKGTGLGLASAYGIIKNHNGNIDVYSEPGKGSIFKIYLPSSDKHAGEVVQAEEKTLKGSETILLVDDEYEFRDVGEEMLRELGYEVITAVNGQEACDIFTARHGAIDLVILDMIMPIMGGGKTFDFLKTIQPSARVLLSSGYSADSEAAEILSRGCDGFIQKPFRMFELSKKLRELLDKD